MKDNSLLDAHKYCCNHKPELERDSMCGCFYCGKIFSPLEILSGSSLTIHDERARLYVHTAESTL
jgi:hypothetical protein